MSSIVHDDKLLTRLEAAEILQLRPQTLAVWAMTGLHLPVVRIGARTVRYRLSDVQKFIDEAYRIVSPWYEEKAVMETVTVRGTENAMYIEKSDLSSSVGTIHDFYTTEMIISATETPEAQLMGLRGYRLLSEDMTRFAIDIQLMSQLDEVFTVMPEWEEVGDRIYIEGDSVYNTGTITIKYSPKPASFEEVLELRALELMLEYATAKTKVALGRLRSKFDGSGDLNFTTDGKDLISEGRETIRDIKESLKTFDFNFTAVR